METNHSDQIAVRVLVRARDDIQALRIRMDNRIGRKADHKQQDVEKRIFRPGDSEIFAAMADHFREQELSIEKNLKKFLKRFPIYTEWLQGIRGVGPILAGWIVAEYDIHKATTASKLIQFTGLNSGQVRAQKRVEHDDGKFELVPVDTMVRGDKLTPGFVAPFNRRLRTAIVGVGADGFIKAQNHYCLEFYYPYKERLENSSKVVMHLGKSVPWKDVNKGHRDRAAKRFMMKHFLQDLYVAWRQIEGLPIRAPYQEEYLGHKHAI